MKKLKVYIDTSVFGGFFDEEFKEYTIPLFSRLLNQDFEIIFSNVTASELSNAPEKVKKLAQQLPEKSTQYVTANEEALNLARKYIEEEVVGMTSFADCIHIALATIHNANILISWNFKHIVNVVRIIGYNSVNNSEGYKSIDIRSPRELLTYEEE